MAGNLLFLRLPLTAAPFPAALKVIDCIKDKFTVGERTLLIYFHVPTLSNLANYYHGRHTLQDQDLALWMINVSCLPDAQLV